MSSRIPPVDTARPDLQEVVGTIVRERGQLGELYPFLLHSPAIASGMISLGNGVRKEASLPDTTRELVVCRVGILNGAVYEVYRHRQIASAVGVEEEELDALADWPASTLFSGANRAALAYADAVTTQVSVGDNLFAELTQHWNVTEILELTVTVAYFNMISRVLVPLRIGTEVSEDPV